MKHPLLTLIITLLAGTATAQAAEAVTAFPGAEGFGRYAQGGRGGKVVTVTRLDDYTSKETPIEGTLRWALEQYKHTEEIEGKTITVYEPLTIVFNVAGNIRLKEELKVKRDYLTIAGQSAPGSGICITGRSMTFNGATGGELWYYGPRRKHLIVRYLRFRPSVPEDQSYVSYGTDVENYEDVIFDHCTMTWANEECLAIYDTHNTTVQYCIAAEGLYQANHKKGTRSYCGVWGGQFASYHHNLIAHNNSRCIRFNGARSHDTVAVVDYHNNVVYNWGNNGANAEGLEVEVLAKGITRNELNMTGNYYKHGPASGYKDGAKPKASDKVNRFVLIRQTQATVDSGYLSRHYVSGNVITHFPQITADNWWCGVQYKQSPYSSDTALAKRTFRADAPSPEVAALLAGGIQTAEEAYETVLAQVGACAPRRDWQDARLVDEVREGTASGHGSIRLDGIIDHPDSVGGWPLLSGEPYTDSDGDGIPDDWEKSHNMKPDDPEDGARITDSGYSNLEVYLNSIPQDFTPMAPIADDGKQPTALETTRDDTRGNALIIHNSNIFIRHQDGIYTLTGQKMR
ncbi:MAG: hypothetical protein IJ169_00200 [Paludibacteraceae bacterium]|nr:hypothetical protein [Paludibacteraceae bacterium]